MFHSLKDQVIVERKGVAVFQNAQADRCFSSYKSDKSTQLTASVLDIKMFYVFQSYNTDESEPNQDSQTIHTAVSRRKRFSLRQLLRVDHDWVNSSIFTTSVDIGKSGSLDQLQQIIERLQKEESLSDLPLFVQINLIRVKKEFIEDVYEGADEFMIQIQDVSQRILHQNLKIERQYLATMNSTVSHEMRNPLNALLASVEIQEQNLK
mmetsp:Transcript_2746/g.4306  ORF Transcript_2746/g.4306 Transcript_2746/m.4306 type:complete len:208 (+) Transcript_2746:1106-1729(+)